MAQDEVVGSHADHPAPARGQVDIWVLAFGLIGAPVIWSAHFLANVLIASNSCSQVDVVRPSSATHATIIAIDILAALIALAALFVSLRAWRATRQENADARNEGGSAEHHAAEVGEGRTRFVAMGGILMSTLFFVAILFDTFAAIVVTSCGR